MAGRLSERAKPYAMNAAPCSWRVRMKRTSGVVRSTSRIGKFIVPGMPKTWSMPSRRRQSTSACAAVIMAMDLCSSDADCAAVLRRAHDGLQHRDIVHLVAAGEREPAPFLRGPGEMLELGALGARLR